MKSFSLRLEAKIRPTPGKIPMETLEVQDRHGEKSCYQDIALIDVLVGNRQKVKYSFQKYLNNFSLSLSTFV